MRIGVDTGGTFTDIIALGGDGGLRMVKVPSTPDDPSRAIAEGILRLQPAGGFEVVHGTTVATNALLERRGAKTALITTQGCRDVLEIARQNRDELYSLNPEPRIPLIPRELRLEVPERLDWRGEVVTPLDTSALEAVLDSIQAAGVESVAVCFLFSFLNPAHEIEAGLRARARGFNVSLSHEIAPEYREYERTSTVCANAFVAPVMERYIGRLEGRLEEIGAGRLWIMQSSGGTLRAEEAAANAVKTALSGPAGGLVAAARIARDAGFDRILTFDMGGTSTDVALVNGEPETIRTGQVAGLPLLTPMLAIHTVGAGGGSIARLDAGGGLRVGPQSAGADPGPVAYGRGDQLTVTDANVLLGRLPASTLLAGSVPLDIDRVRDRFAQFAAQMKVGPERAAEGILAVVNAQMARALRHVSTERGRDPHDYTLVSFGGAGGLHACALAEALRTESVQIPRYPGAFSALGLVLADVRREYARSHFAPAEAGSAKSIGETLRQMERASLAELAADGLSARSIALARFVEARYVGQSFALRVPYRNLRRAVRDFHAAHQSRYGHSDRSEPVEIVTIGLAATGRSSAASPLEPTLPALPGRSVCGVPVYIDNGRADAPLYLRSTLALDQRIDGPAIITQEDATTWLAPGWSARTDLHANLLLTHTSRAI
jgi:N-methylhydantoinase A